MLKAYKRGTLKLFFRPRSGDVLKQMLLLDGIEKIDGFVLPKFDTENMQDYFEILAPYRHLFFIMPVIESRALFDIKKLREIAQFLKADEYKQTLMVRLGGEDMLKHLALKRHCNTSLYDLIAPSAVMANMLQVFKPLGYELSAPVYNCINNREFFQKEVHKDIEQGFIGKTIIHPSQIEALDEMYRVSESEARMAHAMLDEKSEAIIVQDGAMGEKFAHYRWAEVIVKREELYGKKR
jgi:citrate lyase beta subunit